MRFFQYFLKTELHKMKNPDITCRREMTEYLLSLFLTVSLLKTGEHYSQFATVAVCILPAVYLFMLRAVIRLAGKGTDAVLISAAVPGILFIAGGPVFDLSVTLISTPDLKLEANQYVRLLLDSGNSPAFAYLYLFLVVIIGFAVIKSILWIALIKHRSSIVLNINRENVFFHCFWAIALVLISSNLISWVCGMLWIGIEISHKHIKLAAVNFSQLCVCLYLAWLWKSYRQLYHQSEPTVKLIIRIITAVLTYILFITACDLFIVRNHADKTTLKYMDVNINYIAENNMLNKYAEIDDIIQMVTSNPYLDKKQTNGADALWEYCSYNIEERKEEFVRRIKKTSEILKFSERLKLDDRLAATVDNFSTEIVDKAWKHNVLSFGEKFLPCHDRISGVVLLCERNIPYMLTYSYYSEIIAAGICRLDQQGNNNTAKELYMKTLHMSWMLFNGDSFLSQITGLRVMKNLCHDEIISLEIFSEYERKHLNKLKENILFICKKNETGISYNSLRLIRLIKPVIFYYPGRYKKVLTILEPHRNRKFIVPVYYEMLSLRESLSVLDNNSGIFFPSPGDRRFKEIMGIVNTEKNIFLKRTLRYADKNIEACKTENCNPTEHSAYFKDSKLKFIYNIASEWNCKALLWYLRPFVWRESL